MTNKTISMSKIRQIIKLYSQQMGKKKIGNRLGMSKNTVKLYIEQFRSLKTNKEEVFKLTDFELNKLFHPPKEISLNDRLQCTLNIRLAIRCMLTLPELHCLM